MAATASAGLAVAIVLAAVWLWSDSRLPESYSVMDMGYAVSGTSADELLAAGLQARHDHDPSPVPLPAEAGAAPVAVPPTPTISVDDLVTDRQREPDVRYVLTAREGRITLPGGTLLDGYTLNGSSPGPVIEAEQGQLVEVVLHNEDIAEGTTLHWHGIDVPNGEDGVAGVTQDAVLPGERHVYRFVAEDVGTYWYHSHQVSHRQVIRGLLGAVVIRPRATQESDVLALLHNYGGRQTVNGQPGDTTVPLPPGTVARVRLINTDNGPTQVWVSGAAYRVLAVDGRELNAPGLVAGRRVTVTAGARVDLEVTVPATGAGAGAVRVQAPGVSIVLGPEDSSEPPPPSSSPPTEEVDLLTYGEPLPLDLDPTAPDRRFDYIIGRRFGLLDGRPGLWWSVNGGIYPDIPMYMVSEGDVVVMKIYNASGQVHPMHLHGHHALVISRDGVPATGSPWWVDSLDVDNGETYEIAFVADNPGIWMDHCHNLPHAKDGLMAHVMYDGVTTPYLIGGEVDNAPE